MFSKTFISILEEFFTLLRSFTNSIIGLFNQKPSFVTFLTFKYTKNNLQQNFKTVFKF